jgi:hypothetical protein
MKTCMRASNQDEVDRNDFVNLITKEEIYAEGTAKEFGSKLHGLFFATTVTKDKAYVITLTGQVFKCEQDKDGGWVEREQRGNLFVIHVEAGDYIHFVPSTCVKQFHSKLETYGFVGEGYGWSEYIGSVTDLWEDRDTDIMLKDKWKKVRDEDLFYSFMSATNF